MKAAIQHQYELLQQQADLVPLLVPPPPAFADYDHRWLGEQARCISLRTDQRLSQIYLTGLSNSLASSRTLPAPAAAS